MAEAHKNMRLLFLATEMGQAPVSVKVAACFQKALTKAKKTPVEDLTENLNLIEEVFNRFLQEKMEQVSQELSFAIDYIKIPKQAKYIVKFDERKKERTFFQETFYP